MVATKHPSGLNPLQRYRQACSVLRGTSRATNAAWYQSAIDLDYQLHLRTDGQRAESWFFDRRTKQWSAGPRFDETHATDLTLAPAFAAEIIKLSKNAKANSVGVVLHLADEFATSELKPELDNPGALGELRSTIESDPKSVLDDSSVSETETSWRLIPYPAAGSEAIATTVCLSRTWGAFLDELRKAGEEANFPVITLALSAPLVCLLALPEVKRDALTRPLIATLPYPRFTLLAFFNEHGDLRLLRTLQHRGMRRPTGLRHAASTTAAALELADPEVFVLPTGEVTDPQLIADLQLVFPAASIREVDWADTPYRHVAGERVAPEALIAASPATAAESALAASHTFSVLRGDGWAIQNFLPVAREAAEVYPVSGEMKLLRVARYARLGFAGLTLLGLAFFGLQMVDMVRKPEWAFDAQGAKLQKQRVAVLNGERTKMAHWDNLLEDRSKAWASMELLSTMFPENGGFFVKNFSHTAKPETSPGQAKSGIVREWKITGLAREEALEQLAYLNTRDGVSAIFNEVAKRTGNQAFDCTPASRNLMINVRTLENASYRPGPIDATSTTDESSYPFSFDLTIVQRFTNADELAVISAKAP